MKPRIFIGSSVEGINVAYAIHQNLDHDAEVTVWDQGVFELSKTTIESLIDILDIVDFGIFVFSPDDELIMRGDETASIRDNVLFEAGLFIGKLGRERVFFIIPDKIKIQIPSDLLGVKPGKYNPNREDNSLQSATGVFCNQIRNQIDRLGLLRPHDKNEEAERSDDGKDESSEEWFDDLVDNKYESAKKKLENALITKPEEDQLLDKVWLAYINLKLNSKNSRNELISFAEKHKDNLAVQKLIIKMLSWEGYYEKAIELTENELGIDSSNSSIIVLLSDCHKDNGNLDKAIEILNNGLPADNPEIAIASAIIHKEKDDLDKAISVIHSAYMNFPNNELLMFNYSVLLAQKNRFKEALFLFNALTIKYPKNIRYWGNLSNNCLNLDLYDNAMDACKKAEELAQGESAWIQNNIGNLMNNKGFYTEAMQWLNKGLALEPTSQYAHNKLATAIKSKEDEREEFNKYCKEGRKLIRDFSIEPYDKT